MDKAKQKRMRRQTRIIYNDKGPIVGGIGAMRNEMRDKDRQNHFVLPEIAIPHYHAFNQMALEQMVSCKHGKFLKYR